MNGHELENSEGAATGLAQPSLASRTSLAVESAAGDWLCAWCHNRVANERDRFRYNGQHEFSFVNPAGLRFDIITFSETCGCRQSGVPTLADTWFPGHAWSYCRCAECGQHLGWYYAGQYTFAGLIKTRIVRALYVRN